jgi:hypothetical protein
LPGVLLFLLLLLLPLRVRGHSRAEDPEHRVAQSVAALVLLLLLQVRGVHDRVQEILNTEYEASRSYRPTTKDWLASHWQGFMSPAQMSRIRNTGAL